MRNGAYFNEIDVAIGEKVMQARLRCGLSSQEFRGVIGLNELDLVKLESGATRLDAKMLIAVAAALGVNSGSLLPR